jgi:hypothetical protein
VAWKGRVERKGTNLAVDEYFSSKLSIVFAFGETVKQSGFSGTWAPHQSRKRSRLTISFNIWSRRKRKESVWIRWKA